LVNVKGLTLAHTVDNEVFEGHIVARGPLRDEQYLFTDFLNHPDPYENDFHIVSPWAEAIAADALAGRMPRIFPRE